MCNGVYRIRNLINNQCYIGSVAWRGGFSQRWYRHQRELKKQEHHSLKLQNAWNKYGSDAFVFEILLYCEPKDCLIYEQIALDHYQLKYNISLVAYCPMLGRQHTEDTKAKMRQANLGRKHSQETREKIRQAKMGNTYRRGQKHSDDVKAKLSYIAKQRVGERHNRAKLTQIDVNEIRQLLKRSMPQKLIAQRFGVSRQTISAINTGQNWNNHYAQMD